MNRSYIIKYCDYIERIAGMLWWEVDQNAINNLYSEAQDTMELPDEEKYSEEYEWGYDTEQVYIRSQAGLNDILDHPFDFFNDWSIKFVEYPYVTRPPQGATAVFLKDVEEAWVFFEYIDIGRLKDILTHEIAHIFGAGEEPSMFNLEGTKPWAEREIEQDAIIRQFMQMFKDGKTLEEVKEEFKNYWMDFPEGLKTTIEGLYEAYWGGI